MSSRRRAALAPLLLLAAALAACGGAKRTSDATRTATVTRTVTVPATTPATTTPATTTTPAPDPHAPLKLQTAEQTLSARGFDVLTERDYRPDQALKVLLGIRRAPPRAERAFFFYGDRFIGTDTKDPSGAIEVLAQRGGSIMLGYGLFRPGDALCCASGGTAQVTYAWDGTRLVPRGAIPTADPGASLSRR